MEWDARTNRLLLLGTARGAVKAWNVDSKRVVCDASGDDAYPCFADLKCSPSENVFVTATLPPPPRGAPAAPG